MFYQAAENAISETRLGRLKIVKQKIKSAVSLKQNFVRCEGLNAAAAR